MERVIIRGSWSMCLTCRKGPHGPWGHFDLFALRKGWRVTKSRTGMWKSVFDLAKQLNCFFTWCKCNLILTLIVSPVEHGQVCYLFCWRCWCNKLQRVFLHLCRRRHLLTCLYVLTCKKRVSNEMKIKKCQMQNVKCKMCPVFWMTDWQKYTCTNGENEENDVSRERWEEEDEAFLLICKCQMWIII